MSNSTNTGRRERGGGIGEEENGSVMFFFLGWVCWGKQRKHHFDGNMKFV